MLSSVHCCTDVESQCARWHAADDLVPMSEVEPGVESPHEMMQRRFEFWQKAEIEAQERAAANSKAVQMTHRWQMQEAQVLRSLDECPRHGIDWLSS